MQRRGKVGGVGHQGGAGGVGVHFGDDAVEHGAEQGQGERQNRTVQQGQA